MLTADPNRAVYDSILDTIGRTPLVRLNRVTRGLACRMYAKVEFLNPGGSVKDRIGPRMLAAAEQSGALKPGGTVVEGTSGNTGVGLAVACAIKGYKAVFVMPDKMSQEKIQLLRAFGARVVMTPTAVEPEDARSYYSVADKIVAETPNAILANQYHNPENLAAHYQTTGPEIWEQSEGQVTDVVIGMGTGGTITGVGRYLKEQDPGVRVIGVDPYGSLLYETWRHVRLPDKPQVKPYKIEGIGEDFLPTALDLSIVDEVLQIGDKESFLMARRLVRDEGIFCGGSSGSAVAAAVHYAEQLDAERQVVVVLPDSGSRYLSKIFNDDWMRESGFLESTWASTHTADVLDSKASTDVSTATAADRMVDVVSAMKAHDISQLPVVEEGSLVGLVSEVDLLNHMLLAEHKHSPGETIADLVEYNVTTVKPDTPMETLMSLFATGQVAVVTEDSQPVGIITKIDLLDYLATHTN